MIRIALLLGLALLGGCVSTTTHMLVPSPSSIAEMRRLASRDGAVAIAITTAGEEQALTVKPDRPDLLSGTALDNPLGPPADAPARVRLPFESLALVYYTNPTSPRVPLIRKLPWKSRFPEPRKAGKPERELSCDALDIELARAEAQRYLARSNGALPYTSGEKLKLHAEHIAIDVGVTVAVAVVVVAVAYGGGTAIGGGGCWSACGPPNDGDWHVSPQGYRWSIGAIDDRIEGLLRLKAHQACRARPSVHADSTDLQILADLDAWQSQQPAATDERTLLSRRTSLFDELGPKPLGVRLRADQPVRRAEDASQVATY